MSLVKRRILYIAFILIFIVATPLLWTYAAGYKINFRKGAIQKTGALILDTEPRGAKIYIDGKPASNFLTKYFSEFGGEKDEADAALRTPAKIKGLLPGEYDVRMELQGHWPWEKKLSVAPGASTYAEDITLFRNSLPLFLKKASSSASALSPNKKYLAFAENGVLKTANLSDEKINTALAATASSSAEKMIWSLQSKKILFQNKIYSADNLAELYNLNKLGVGELNPKWSLYDDNIIYLLTDGSLIELDLSARKTKTAASADGTEDYLVKDGRIMFINKTPDSANLEILSAGSDEIIRTIKLPLSNSYVFLNASNDLLNVYDRDHKILYLIDPESALAPLKEIISNVVAAEWAKNNLMLYSTSFELWTYDSDSGQKTLLTRISEAIKKIIWHPSGNYIIYATDKQIFTIELDDRNRRNITPIINLENGLKNPDINADGDILYFHSKIGNQEGIYKLAI